MSTPRISEFIGYSAEVSQPGGPAVEGFFLDRWAQKAQARFEEWLIEHDAEVKAAALKPVRDALSGHPACDRHEDDSPITCGWKLAVADATAALRAHEEEVERGRELRLLATAHRCPGCGSVVPEDGRQTCRPLDVDTSEPGYAYLRGQWGYCYTLSRNVRSDEAEVWREQLATEGGP